MGIHAWLMRLGLAGRGRPAATHFLLSRQKKVSKEKATRLAGSLRFATGNLRCAQKTGVRANSPTAQTSAAQIPLFERSTGPARTGLAGADAGKRCPHRVVSGFWFLVSSFWFLVSGLCSLFFGCWLFPRSHPFCLRRGAQGQTDQGSCLSEPQASLHETPAGLSTAGCPVAQRRGRRQQGRLFFGDFLLAKQKKVTRRRAIPGQQSKTEKTKSDIA